MMPVTDAGRRLPLGRGGGGWGGFKLPPPRSAVWALHGTWSALRLSRATLNFVHPAAVFEATSSSGLDASVYVHTCLGLTLR